MSANLDESDLNALSSSNDAAMEKEMIEKLSALILEDENFEKLSKVQDVYCPFKALGVEKTEIRHSNFLADILSPKNLHGFGDIILRKFCEALLIAAEKPELALNLHISDLSNVIIKRETENIDLLIIFPQMCSSHGLVIAIELKVRAKESKGQLEKYEGVLKEMLPQATKVFFFVTPDKAEATRSNWVNVGFETIIASIEDSIQEIKGHPSAMMMIQSYIDMMRREYMNISDPELERLAEKIWNEHREALEFLSEYQPSPGNIKEQLESGSFLKEINAALHAKDCRVQLISGENKSKRYINFVVKEWGELEDMRQDPSSDFPQLLKFEISFSKSHCRTSVVLCPGESQRRIKIYDIFEDKGVLQKKRKTMSAEWTKLSTRTICNESEMEEIIGQDEDSDQIKKLKKNVINYFIEVIPRFHKAVLEAAEEGLIK